VTDKIYNVVVIKGKVMSMQATVKNIKKEDGNSRFASLPLSLQSQIKHYLERGDFRAAKALFDASLREEREKH
jgi:hypothetical protein